jgi:hypothetical protein
VRDAAGMEWTWVVTTTLPVLTFIGGLWWNRSDGDRRERRASRAAALAAFEQLQRDTSLELQDALGLIFRTAAVGSMDEYRAVAMRVTALQARLADPEARLLSVEAASKATTLSQTDPTRYSDERHKAGDEAAHAMTKAVEYLGMSIREPPSG